MGRVEKLVVLGVLFVITVILVVSMNTRAPLDSMGGGGEDPLSILGDRDRRENPGQPSQPSQRWARPRETPASRAQDGPISPLAANSAGDPAETQINREGDLLASGEGVLPTPVEPRRVGIDASADSEAAVDGEGDGTVRGPALLESGVIPEDRDASLPATIPADWELVRLEGLRATPDESTLLYTCEKDLSFESLALYLYGDESKQDLLQRNNEGRRSLQAGTQVFVPVRDDAPVNLTEYVVVDGDSLWEIAKKVYGKGHRWEEIFDWNSDQLSSPEALREGMVLQIP